MESDFFVPSVREGSFVEAAVPAFEATVSAHVDLTQTTPEEWMAARFIA